MINKNVTISHYDPDVWNYIEKEKIRQENHITLIASENYASDYVMKIQGSQLTNKYAEGYPNKRYYGGCEYIDPIEQIAIDRAKKIFHADYANVQPHSGSQANFAVYSALLKPGDLILGMNLSHGGHLTHGAAVNFSGKLYRSMTYGIDETTGDINYIQLQDIALKYKPKMIIGGFSSFSGICNWKKMKTIADSIQAYLMIDIAHVAGLIAAGLYPNPIEYADVVTTTTHKTLSGPRGGLILSKNKDNDFYKKLDSSVFPGSQGGPLMHVIAAKAIAFKEVLDPKFILYQKQILKNANIMVKTFLKNGFKVISGKTNNHLFVLNLKDKNITGKQAEFILDLSNITVNKNNIPNDVQNPFITSGIRIGTPAITRRGFKEEEAVHVSNWIIDIINNFNNTQIIYSIKKKVLSLCAEYPIYLNKY
ncbi:serine hydroxymethyltransferase [Buchnera aphidicola]|uniref:Serine hydroxymethyltransferase n=1 Tax=Buchnera aphidicola (Stegophylla sp.) TaxID=2315800 RepID=A0A4D6YIX4_9GAMM|nr:serine hydroxymethyltransferase [Buchnera aphidicola (Stegophylla sp.)]QCI26361.1 serine hydroxymethyltransferase [Buchnera aphidicola (Stegophylla sp.)]